MNDDKFDILVCALNRDMYGKSVGIIAFAHIHLVAWQNPDSVKIVE